MVLLFFLFFFFLALQKFLHRALLVSIVFTLLTVNKRDHEFKLWINMCFWRSQGAVFFLGPFKNKRNSDPSGGNFNRKTYHLIVLVRCFSFLLRKTEKKGLKTKPHKDTKGDEIKFHNRFF